MLEKKIEKAICEYAKEQGLLVDKFTSPARRGVPDRLFTLPNGRMFFMETKSLGNVPTPSQERDHARRRAHNVTVYWTDNIALGIQYIADEIAHMKSNA
jgi:hypothetical protein